MKFFRHILGASKFEVHLHNFSKVLTRSGYGGKIYVLITREAYQIFNIFSLLLKGMIYSLLNFL